MATNQKRSSRPVQSLHTLFVVQRVLAGEPPEKIAANLGIPREEVQSIIINIMVTLGHCAGLIGDGGMDTPTPSENHKAADHTPPVAETRSDPTDDLEAVSLLVRDYRQSGHRLSIIAHRHGLHEHSAYTLIRSVMDDLHEMIGTYWGDLERSVPFPSR